MPKPLISIVDDDETVRATTMDLISSMGFPVKAFACADDFLNSDDLCRTSCLVADMRMPGMDGRDVLQVLEANPHLRGHARVALMSAGWGITQPCPDPRPAVVEAVLEKPFELDTIINIVTKLAS